MKCKQCGDEFDPEGIIATLELWHQDVDISQVPKDLCWDCLCDYIWNNQLDGCENIYDD